MQNAGVFPTTLMAVPISTNGGQGRGSPLVPPRLACSARMRTHRRSTISAVGRTADDATCNAVALDEWRLSRHRLLLGNKHCGAQTTVVSLTMPLVAALYNNLTTMRSVFITILQQLS
jgi:hypothetical protein